MVGVRYHGVNVIKYLRKHLEEEMAGPADGSGEPSWVMATEGRAAAEAWPEREAWDSEPPERVWEFRFPAQRLPILIGRGD